jgi:hypothetical protein
MSLEAITDATARALAEVDGIKAAYASSAGGQGTTVKPIPQDLSDTPVALVTHNGFELQPGSFERIKHTINAELWFTATNAAAAEKLMLPLVTLCIATFRSKVGLYGSSTTAVIRRGGPPRDEEVNGKPYLVYPLTVEVMEATVQNYALS